MAVSKWDAVYGRADDLLDMTWTNKRPGLCMIFIRPKAVAGLGHAGWAFEVNDGQFCYGGTENVEQSDLPGGARAWSSFHQGTKEQGGDNQAWNMITYDDIMFRTMLKCEYSHYKVITVERPKVAAAWNQVLWNNKCGFTGITNNCLDATHRVLFDYGAPRLPWPATNMAPNWYFKNVNGRVRDTSYLLDRPSSAHLLMSQFRSRFPGKFPRLGG